MDVSAFAQEPRREALRVGVLHPQPHLCTRQEPTERDLAVLRLAYGQALLSRARLAAPAFYEVEARGGTARLTLRAGSWGEGFAPSAAWLAELRQGIPALKATSVLGRLAGAPALTWEVDRKADPMWASRLWGSRLLPERAIPPGTAAQPAAAGCRAWPAGVRMRNAPRRGLTYAIQRPGPAAPLELLGYVVWRQLADDLAGGRLDAVLAEGQDFQGEPPAGPIGVLTGTQQVVLRFSPRVAPAVTPDLRRLLSLAVNRPALVAAAPLAAFAPASAYLESVSAPGVPDEALRWDSREARRDWLAPARPRPASAGAFRLGYARHPLLETWAERLAAQWQKTLEVAVTVQAADPERLDALWADGSLDLMLAVLDLEDGSLQDAWVASGMAANAAAAPEAPGAAGAPPPEAIAAWELALRMQRPYLPLLVNQQLVLARGPGSAARIAEFCPGCRVVNALP